MFLGNELKITYIVVPFVLQKREDRGCNNFVDEKEEIQFQSVGDFHHFAVEMSVKKNSSHR